MPDTPFISCLVNFGPPLDILPPPTLTLPPKRRACCNVRWLSGFEARDLLKGPPAFALLSLRWFVKRQRIYTSFGSEYVSADCDVLRANNSSRLGAWPDLAMMALTFLLTLLWNVEVGITVSVAASLLLVIHRSSRARLSVLVHPLLSCP